MARFLLKVWSSNEDSEFSYAVVEINTRFAKEILELHSSFLGFLARHGRAYEVSAWDYSVSYYSRDEKFEEVLSEEESVILPMGFKTPKNRRLYTDCNRIVVGQHDVHWECCPKNSSEHLDTVPISIGEIRQIAGSGASKKAGAA